MPSTYTSRLRLEMQATGENLNSWGDRLNALATRLEEANAKVISKTISGNVTLTVQNAIEDEARSMCLVLTGSPGATYKVTIPLVQKGYWVVNNTNADQNIGGATGASATVRQGKWAWVYCDGTDTKAHDPEPGDLKPATAPLNMNGQKITNAAAGTASTDGATLSNKIHQFAAPTSALAMNAQKITGLADPTNDQDAATKIWVATTYAGAVASAEAARDAAIVAQGDAETAEVNAAAYAADAALQAAKLSGTSTTSNSIGTGSKSFTTQAAKFFSPGARVLITSDASPASRSMFGTVTAYSGTSLTVDVAATAGSGTYTDWTIRVSGERGAVGPAGTVNIPRSAKSSGYTVALSDIGALIDCTGTFTLGFSAASTLGSGFAVYIRNAGTGEITLDPNSSETIDGLTSFITYPNEARIVQCDGVSFNSIVLSPFSKTFTASGTFTKPPGYAAFEGLIWGGGGGGGRANGTSGVGGGGGGACVPFSIPASSMGATETVTIAAGGAAQTGTGSGGAGGTSSIGTLAFAYGGGGGGGVNGQTNMSGGSGGGALSAGQAATANTNYQGGEPSSPTLSVGQGLGGGWNGNGAAWGGGGGANSGGATGNTVYGGAGGGGVSNAGVLSAPGASTYGGSGGAASDAGNGTAGNAPGGGGGGCRTGTTSGAGARGEVRIWGR